ncbi:MAG: transglutaminase-like domain-containing protein [Nitrospirota bacterium]
MPKTFKVVNLLIFFTWTSLLSFLLYKDYAGTTFEKPEALKASFAKETYWYDIYAGTKKIGFAVSSFERAGNEIIIKHELEMRVKKDGEDTVLIERLKSLCDLSYSIKSFEYTSNFKDEKGIKVTGEADIENIIFFLESGEKRKTHKISRKGKDFYLPITLIPAIHSVGSFGQKSPSPGSVFQIPMLNLITFSFDEVRVVLEEIRPIKVSINVLSLYKIRAGKSIYWMNEKGIVIKEEHPSGLTFYLQIEKFAIDPDDKILFDYTALPVLKSDQLLSNTEKLKLLKIKIKGYGLDPQLYNNSSVNLYNNILTIQKEDTEELKKTTYSLPYAGDNFKIYLVPDSWVNSDYKPLEDTGKIYARLNKYDPFLFTNYLNGYLYGIIRTAPMFFLSDSVNILKSLSGDYLERTVLFASYSRAAGLPTRLIGGLVYRNGYFYFHTWPEVWFENWIPVDPTFFQFPADVTHIPLKEGTLEDITSIVKDLEGIKIEILEEAL